MSPLYIHVLINRLPEMGLGISLLSLFLGFCFGSLQARRVALILVILCAGSAWPVLKTGQKGYDAIYYSLEKDDQAWLNAHMNAAEHWVWGFIFVAALALLTLVSSIKWPRAEWPLSLSVLLLGACMIAVGGYISYLGGRVRHVEFRDGPPPIVKPEKP